MQFSTNSHDNTCYLNAAERLSPHWLARHATGRYRFGKHRALHSPEFASSAPPNAAGTSGPVLFLAPQSRPPLSFSGSFATLHGESYEAMQSIHSPHPLKPVDFVPPRSPLLLVTHAYASCRSSSGRSAFCSMRRAAAVAAPSRRSPRASRSPRTRNRSEMRPTCRRCATLCTQWRVGQQLRNGRATRW